MSDKIIHVFQKNGPKFGTGSFDNALHRLQGDRDNINIRTVLATEASHQDLLSPPYKFVKGFRVSTFYGELLGFIIISERPESK